MRKVGVAYGASTVQRVTTRRAPGERAPLRPSKNAGQGADTYWRSLGGLFYTAAKNGQKEIYFECIKELKKDFQAGWSSGGINPQVICNIAWSFSKFDRQNDPFIQQFLLWLYNDSIKDRFWKKREETPITKSPDSKEYSMRDGKKAVFSPSQKATLIQTYAKLYPEMVTGLLLTESGKLESRFYSLPTDAKVRILHAFVGWERNTCGYTTIEEESKHVERGTRGSANDCPFKTAALFHHDDFKQASPKHTSLAMMILAKLGRDPWAVIYGNQESFSKFHTCQDLSIALWSIAIWENSSEAAFNPSCSDSRGGYRRPDYRLLVQTVREEMNSTVIDMTPQGVSVIAWSLAKLVAPRDVKIEDELNTNDEVSRSTLFADRNDLIEIFQTLRQHAFSFSERQWKTQEISVLIWACGRLRIHDPLLFRRLLGFLQDRRVADHHKAQIITACNKLNYFHSKLFKSFVIENRTSLDIVNLAHLFAVTLEESLMSLVESSTLEEPAMLEESPS